MSHFLCYVFTKPGRPATDEVERLLAPYDEGDERYFKYEPLDEECVNRLRENYRTSTLEEIAESTGYYLNDDGALCDYSNPNAKWDYYQTHTSNFAIIMRDDGTLVNSCPVDELPPEPESPFAMVTSNGDWDECGQVLWFGMSDANDETRNAFAQRFRAYVAAHPDEIVTAVDCHI